MKRFESFRRVAATGALCAVMSMAIAAEPPAVAAPAAAAPIAPAGTLAEAQQRLGRAAGFRATMPRAWYAAKIASGEITAEDQIGRAHV